MKIALNFQRSNFRKSAFMTNKLLVSPLMFGDLFSWLFHVGVELLAALLFRAILPVLSDANL